MLDFEDGFRRILVAPQDVFFKVVIREGAVYLLERLAGFECCFPFLVPDRHLRNDHICHGRSEPVACVVAGAGLRHQGNYLLKVGDDLVAGLRRTHSRKHRYALQHLVVGHVVEVEGHVAEETGEGPVVEAAQGLDLAQQFVALGVGKDGAFPDAFHREVAALHSEISLLPYVGSETGFDWADVELRVERTRGAPDDIRNAFGSKEVVVNVYRFQRDVAAVHHRLALLITAEEVFGRTHRRCRFLVQRAGRKSRRAEDCQNYSVCLHDSNILLER